jgi:tRNA (cytidine32/uridine32-2'-O)-methyltransferase
LSPHEISRNASENIRIVLIEPKHPGNIGAVARAMKTMSLANLYLVRPVEFPSFDAERRAVGALDTLNAATVVERLEDAIGDCRLVIGTTARARAHPHPVLSARSCAEKLAREANDRAPAAVLFGPERTGLSNRDMDACTFQLTIPTNPEFASLNLASAVQLLSYEIFLASEQAPAADPRSLEYPNQSDMEFFYKHLEKTLVARNFLDEARREVTVSKMRRLFGRARPRIGELKLLHSLVKLMERGGD